MSPLLPSAGLPQNVDAYPSKMAEVLLVGFCGILLIEETFVYYLVISSIWQASTLYKTP